MGKSELRNVEPADERAMAANEEFEILSFSSLAFASRKGSWRSKTSRAMHEKIFFFFSLEINLITKVLRRSPVRSEVAEAAAADVGHHQTSGRF